MPWIGVFSVAFVFEVLIVRQIGAHDRVWMNTIIAVGIGDRTEEGPGYEIYEIL